MTDIYTILGHSGGAFIIGVLLGFTAKKLINVFAFIVGMQIAFFTYLEYINLVNINWNIIERIINSVQELVIKLQFPENMTDSELYNTSSTIVGLSIGLFIGYFYA